MKQILRFAKAKGYSKNNPIADIRPGDLLKSHTVENFASLMVFEEKVWRRVDCRHCGVVVEEVPWSDGKHRLTRAYMLFLARWARKLSWKDTAKDRKST